MFAGKTTNTPAIEVAEAWLQRGLLSTGQLRTRLTRRGFANQAVESVIANLTARGRLDDDVLMREILDNAERNGRGARWIRLAAAKRELSERFSERLSESELHDEMPARARGVLRRAMSMRKIQSDDGEVDQQTLRAARARAVLKRRGFARETVEVVVGGSDQR